MLETEAVKLFKCLADPSRLRIIKSLLQGDMYVELLAERLSLTSATVSFHMKKLEDAGVVRSRKEQYYTVYALNKDLLKHSLESIIDDGAGEDAQQRAREEAYRQKVIDTFFEYGVLKAIPAQRKKRRICLEKIADAFEKDRIYEEKEVNEIILRYHADYCTIRREMICEGLMHRENMRYRRV